MYLCSDGEPLHLREGNLQSLFALFAQPIVSNLQIGELSKVAGNEVHCPISDAVVASVTTPLLIPR